MIFDSIDNWGTYFDASGTFGKILDTLSSVSVDTANDEYGINESCYYKVMSYETKLAPTIIESHKKEVDIQVVLKGGEGINIYNNTQVEIIAPYDTKTDCQFYKSIQKPSIDLRLTPGQMAVFFPQDIHGCQYALDSTTESIKKIVIKIDEKLFTR